MCLLIAAHKFPDRDLLKAAEEINGHGIGFAYLTKDGVKFFKGITLDELFDFGGLQTDMLIHFRIATVGDKVPELCHPFPITQQVELDLHGVTNAVLGHNGTIGSWRELVVSALHYENPLPAGDHWSDTRAAAFLVHTYGANIIRLIGEGQRLAILSDGTNPKFGPRGWRINGNWHKFAEDVYTSQNMEHRIKKSFPQQQQQTTNTNSSTGQGGASNNGRSNNWKEYQNGSIYSPNASGTGGRGQDGTFPKSTESKGEKEAKEEIKARTTTTIKAREDGSQQTPNTDNYLGQFRNKNSNIIGGIETFSAKKPQGKCENIHREPTNLIVPPDRYPKRIHEMKDTEFSEC